MAAKVLNYIPRDSFIHRLSGTTKLIIFLSFSFLCGLSFDTRVLLFLLFMICFSGEKSNNRKVYFSRFITERDSDE